MNRRTIRVGQIVPSSNTTMETEVPKFFRMFEGSRDDVEFTFHSSRMRMKHVRKEELAKMDQDSRRCAVELSDAPIDVTGYACLVAIMGMGLGYHRKSEKALMEVAAKEGAAFPVITSAGALISELKLAGHKCVSLLMPYTDELSQTVVAYIENEGISVSDYRNFSVADNQKVGRIPGTQLLEALSNIDTKDIDAVVLSCCVQMPSFDTLEEARGLTSIPITSTSECTAQAMLRTLGYSVDFSKFSHSADANNRGH